MPFLQTLTFLKTKLNRFIFLKIALSVYIVNPRHGVNPKDLTSVPIRCTFPKKGKVAMDEIGILPLFSGLISHVRPGNSKRLSFCIIHRKRCTGVALFPGLDIKVKGGDHLKTGAEGTIHFS